MNYKRSGKNIKCSSGFAAANNIAVQRSPAIGAVNDPLEHEADAVADKVMRMPEHGIIQRKCAGCEEEEKVQLKPLVSSITPFIQAKSDAAGQASESVTQKINSARGNGSVMDKPTQSFMENSFGTDFSNVKIHTGDYAVQMSQELNAQAFTVGNDIFFNNGKFDSNSDTGKHLLAHELTHTLQQEKGFTNTINRKLSVTDPAASIPNPTGKGLVQTNRVTVLKYLSTLCASGSPAVSAGGEVSVSPSFCTDKAYPPDFIGPIPMTASKSGTPVGCGCICDLVASANDWHITVDDSSWPHTVFADDPKARTPGSGGSGGEVTTPSPNSPKLWGAVTATGIFQDIDPWLVLGHELCGHGWLGDKGEAGKDEVKPRGRGGHQETVERENLLRDEHGLGRRGTYRQPYCGESFSHATGTAASFGTVTMSSYFTECQKWRKEYNKLNGTAFTDSDVIPVKVGEILPP